MKYKATNPDAGEGSSAGPSSGRRTTDTGTNKKKKKTGARSNSTTDG
jgi:hypothetical protein